MDNIPKINFTNVSPVSSNIVIYGKHNNNISNFKPLLVWQPLSGMYSRLIHTWQQISVVYKVTDEVSVHISMLTNELLAIKVEKQALYMVHVLRKH